MVDFIKKFLNRNLIKVLKQLFYVMKWLMIDLDIFSLNDPQEFTFTGLSSLVFVFSSFLMSRRVFSQFFHYYRENPTHEAYPAFTRAYVSGFDLIGVMKAVGLNGSMKCEREFLVVFTCRLSATAWRDYCCLMEYWLTGQ